MASPFTFGPQPPGGFTTQPQMPTFGTTPNAGTVPGGGIDWTKILMGGGLLAGAGADLYGAFKQNQINQQNFAAQQAQQQILNGLVGGYLSPANQQNPFSAAIMNFLGQNRGQQQGLQNPGGQVRQGMTGNDLQNPSQYNGGMSPRRGGMYQYQDTPAAQYNPSQLGQAPTIGSPMQQNITPFEGSQAGPLAQFNPSMIGTQGVNTGQDPLMQMMRANVSTPPGSPDPMTQAGLGQFDNTNLMNALKSQDQQLLDEQVNQLHGSAGDFGKRFGTDMMRNEAQLRNQFATNIAAQNAQLQSQSFENAAGRNLQGLLANQQAGLQAGLQNQQLGAQLGMFNAGNQQQAGLQGQQLNQLIGSQNQQSALQALLANQGLAGQYGLANQNAMNQAGQFNASMLQNQNQFGAQQGNIYNQLVMSGLMNAAGLQNQQMGQNISLLGILGGLGIPQQQVNPMYGAIGDAATTAGMLPMLMQMMGGR